MRTRDRLSGMAHRRLAEGGEGVNQYELSVIEDCLDLEAEMGLLQQRAISSSTIDSSSRVTQLVSMLQEAAAAQESMHGSLPIAVQLPSSEQWLGYQSGFAPADGGLVHMQTPLIHASAEHGESSMLTPGLDPNSWIDAAPRFGLQSIGQEGHGFSPVTDDERRTEHAPAVPPWQRYHRRDFKEIIWTGDIRSHPYVRLPVLGEGVFPRYIDAMSLFVQRPWKLSPHTHLATIRSLLLQKTLNQMDVNSLMNAVERLIISSWIQGKKGARGNSPIYLVEALGNYFLAFDAIVCTAEVLGRYMLLPVWWNTYVSAFHTNYDFPVSAVGMTELAGFNTELAKRLVAALEIYKQGMRPPLMEVVALKRLLFCYPLGRHRLKDGKWDDWRKDGEMT